VMAAPSCALIRTPLMSTAPGGRCEVGAHCVCKRRVRSPRPVHGVNIRQMANTLLEEFDPARRLLRFCRVPKVRFLLTLRPSKHPGRSTEHLAEMARQMALVGKACGIRNLR